VQRLDPPDGEVRIVLDTDAYNEVDDQFALAYALCSDRLDVEAVYAAPFDNERSTGPADGMEQSYAEIRRLLSLLDRDPEGFAFRGSGRYLDDGGPVESPAVDDLLDRARADRSGPLYVVAVGAPTNVASAIRRAPAIVEDVVVVWLGGHPYRWPTASEFNLRQDLAASRTLFDSGVPLVHVPCKNVAEHVATTVPELAHYLEGRGAVSDYLLDTVRQYRRERDVPAGVWRKQIWDLAPLGYLVEPDWVPTVLDHSPELTAELSWNVDRSRHLLRVATDVDRDPLLADVFDALGDR
jgi:inosine-uridine nucleoside N-ribohydrolase